MKNLQKIALILMAAVVALACTPLEPPTPGPGHDEGDTTIVTPVDTTAITVTVAEAIAIINDLEAGAQTTQTYRIAGTLTQNITSPDDIPGSYTNINFLLEDATGSIKCYYTNNLGNQPFTASSQVPRAGSELTIVGVLKSYVKNDAVTPEVLNGYIESVQKFVGGTDLDQLPDPRPATGDTISVSDAYNIAMQLAEGSTADAENFIIGVVCEVGELNTSYGNATFTITDKSQKLICYRTKSINGADFTNSSEIQVGDIVVVKGKLQNYYGKAELAQGGQLVTSSNPNVGTDGGNTGDVVGKGIEADPYLASDVLILNNTKAGNAYVRAYIVGCVKNGSQSFSANTMETSAFTGNTNLLIADAANETDVTRIVPVQLPQGALRTALNLVDNPSMFGQQILIYGSLEKYFGKAGIKNPSYALVNGQEYGTKPAVITGDELLNETLLTQASFNKFTAQSVKGDEVWTFDAQYGAKMSGFENNASHENEDWFISPAFNAPNGATLSFDHARGPEGSMSVALSNYTVWYSTNYSNDVTSATWTEITGVTHGTTKWTYVSSGALAIPAGQNIRIAWKYTCSNSESATWEIKNVIVK